VIGKPARIHRLPEQPGDVRQTFADVSLAANELGYCPATPFREGIQRYVDWYRS
jgi:UDP-glucuronate 4-epimerase